MPLNQLLIPLVLISLKSWNLTSRLSLIFSPTAIITDNPTHTICRRLTAEHCTFVTSTCYKKHASGQKLLNHRHCSYWYSYKDFYISLNKYDLFFEEHSCRWLDSPVYRPPARVAQWRGRPLEHCSRLLLWRECLIDIVLIVGEQLLELVQNAVQLRAHHLYRWNGRKWRWRHSNGPLSSSSASSWGWGDGELGGQCFSWEIFQSQDFKSKAGNSYIN